jgi:ubiquinone/menaquinone biosynthesis C-methylase UbiE
MGNSAPFQHSRPPSAAYDRLVAAPEPSDPDHDRTRAKYRRLARRYDRFISGVGGRVSGFDRQRARAVEKLDLHAGDVVIDVGCGTGLSFALIEQRIGPSGLVIGVELSPEMLAVARRRVEQHGWSNVTLIESSVEEAKVEVEADAALFCLVHDITRSRGALQNVVSQLKPGGHIGVLGGKALPRKALPLNIVSRWMLARFVTTFDGIEQPWTLLAEWVPELRVEAKLLRLTYLAWGRTPSGVDV